MKRIVMLCGVLVLMGTMLQGCDSSEGDKETPFRVLDLPAETRGEVDICNDFSVDFFKKECDRGGNTVVSPISVVSLTSVLCNGADGDVRDEFLGRLGCSADASGLEILNAYNKVMLEELPGLDSRVAFRMANSLWHSPELMPKADFLDVTGKNYGLTAFNVSPSTQDGMKKMNQWISDNTEGEITKFLLSPLSTTCALANTTYFNGKWSEPFDKSKTMKDLFHNFDGTDSYPLFMSKNEKLRYSEDDIMKSVRIPYGNGNFEMVCILPKEASGYDEMIENLTYGRIKTLLSESKIADVDLRLPKFESQFKENVMDDLVECGLPSIPKNEFNGIFDSASVTFNQFLHGVVIKVDESGTVAAAVSVVGGEISNYFEKVSFVLDRPFVYLIRESTTGAILFMGTQKKF